MNAPLPVNGDAGIIASVNAGDYSAAAQISSSKVHLDRIRAMGTSAQSTSYPYDMNNHGGPRMATATQHFLFVNAPASTWGNPRAFMTDANANMSSSSAYYHMLDQYAGATTNNRYPMGSTDVLISAPVFVDSSGLKEIGENDIMGILHAGLVALGLHSPGYTHEFHVFLPPGVDHCFDYSAQCYSPDNPATWTFCAYHGSVTFTDLGHVVYSVEPYQGSPGTPICYASTVSLANATDGTLSHEFFESVSDPDTNGWWNSFSGNEIGDECVESAVPAASLTLNGHAYVVQKEYSNLVHGCGP